ncbi:MAG: alpha/beta hydrolase family protein [Candidatus Cryosericum sp.]
MGTLIFMTAVVVEIVFGVFCIVTRSYQTRARSVVRIAAFACFVLFAVLPIIRWSLRYYAVFALLFLLAVQGSVALIRKTDEKRAYKAPRVVLKAIGMTVLIFAVTLPAIIFPQHKTIATTGEYWIATAAYTYTDANRVETFNDTGAKRKLSVEFWYPENYGASAIGTCPLIVFSHGSMGTKSSNLSLYGELASHGYVVVAIDHTYQCLYSTDENGHTTLIDMGFLKELQAEDPKSDIKQSHEYYQKWMEIRTGDINFVIDYILAEAKQGDADAVYKLIDAEKVGMMGHSLGGSAALGIGRMRGDVTAVIALEAPFMCDMTGVKNDEFVWNDETYPIPVLNVYSDASWSHLGNWPQYAENYRLLAGTSATAFNVHISGVGHLTLTDLALTSPFLTRVLNGQKSTADAQHCLETINKVCLAYFDCFLKGEGVFTPSGTY